MIGLPGWFWDDPVPSGLGCSRPTASWQHTILWTFRDCTVSCKVQYTRFLDYSGLQCSNPTFSKLYKCPLRPACLSTSGSSFESCAACNQPQIKQLQSDSSLQKIGVPAILCLWFPPLLGIQRAYSTSISPTLGFNCFWTPDSFWLLSSG